MEGALLAGDGPVRRLGVEEAAGYRGSGFLWLHIDGGDALDAARLGAGGDVPEVAAGALAASETRPRCDRIDEGAILNLRGPGEIDPEDSDRLVSIRMWITARRVVSLSRRRLGAIAEAVGLMETERIRDAGDLVAAFARAISTELDPDVADAVPAEGFHEVGSAKLDVRKKTCRRLEARRSEARLSEAR